MRKKLIIIHLKNLIKNASRPPPGDLYLKLGMRPTTILTHVRDVDNGDTNKIYKIYN